MIHPLCEWHREYFDVEVHLESFKYTFEFDCNFYAYFMRMAFHVRVALLFFYLYDWLHIALRFVSEFAWSRRVLVDWTRIEAYVSIESVEFSVECEWMPWWGLLMR